MKPIIHWIVNNLFPWMTPPAAIAAVMRATPEVQKAILARLTTAHGPAPTSTLRTNADYPEYPQTGGRYP